MRWSDIGYLLSVSANKENSSLAKVFSREHGCVTGVVYGSSSKKKKPDLQIGNKVRINYNSKNEDALGYFSFELIENISIKYFNDFNKLNLLIISIEVISKIMPENQKHIICFDEFDEFIKSLDGDSLKSYLIWEFNFLKNIGYGIDTSEEGFDPVIKNILNGNSPDFTIEDLKSIFNLNSETITNRLVDVINISNFNNRSKILTYLNE
ncbi:MAG: DNA repair protein RecO [Pelagibacteraceae bacterium]|nr:DNA repair protein RecO [Pelagibacteraceae bacterium]MCI5079248.1 DNA repair protein RecO [Pelagibacteraceae bacterium]